MAEFKVPDVGEGIKEVDLAALNVAVGDVIEAGMIVAEVETEKAAAEVDCPISGTVTAIHAKPGDTVKVGSVLLTIEASSGAAAAPAPVAPAAPVAAEAPVAAAQTQVAPAAPAPSKTAPAKALPVAASEDQAPAPAGPATRRLARQLGVDLHKVSGSGSGGRITQEDVKDFVKNVMEGGGASSGGGGGYTPPPLPDLSKWGEITREPMNKIARSAAANLSMCWNVIPHVTQHELVDVTDLEAARRRSSEIAKK